MLLVVNLGYKQLCYQVISNCTAFIYILTTVVELLLKHPKIDVNIESDNGLTPLMEASKLGFSKVVAPILFHPDVQVKKAMWDNGNTALIYACNNGYSTVVDLLLRCPETDVSYQMLVYC